MPGNQGNQHYFSVNFLFLSFIYLLSILATTVAANYFFKIYHFYFAGGIFIFSFSFLIGAMIGEVYNYSYQRLVIILSVIIQLIFIVYINIFTSLTPADFFHDQKSYLVVFSPINRYFLWAICGLYFSELINVYLLTKWKCSCPGRGYVYRAFFCIALSQFILSLVVNIGAFNGKTAGIHQLINLTLSNYIMKMIVTTALLLPYYFIVTYLKKKEKVLYLDIKTKFSPFSLQINNVYDNGRVADHG